MFGFLDVKNFPHTVKYLMPSLVEAYVSPILEDPPEMVSGARDILDQVNKKGYKVGLICNTGTTPGRTIGALLEKLNLMKFFDVTTFSNELGIRKPDPRIFLRTLTPLKSQPHTSAHVGDSIEADVWGAKNVGMISVHYRPAQIPCDDIMPHFTIENLDELGWILADLKQIRST